MLVEQGGARYPTVTVPWVPPVTRGDSHSLEVRKTSEQRRGPKDWRLVMSPMTLEDRGV